MHSHAWPTGMPTRPWRFTALPVSLDIGPSVQIQPHPLYTPALPPAHTIHALATTYHVGTLLNPVLSLVVDTEHRAVSELRLIGG